MSSGQPWSVKGIDPRAREIAKDLARRSGMTLGEWLNQVILEDGPLGGEAEGQMSTGAWAGGEPGRPHDLVHGFGPSSGQGRSFSSIREPAERLAPRYDVPDIDSDLRRVTEALDRLTARIEASEHRSTAAVKGIDQSVVGLLTRIESSEQDQSIISSRLENALTDVRADQGRITERMRRIDQDQTGPRALEAIRALEGSIGRVAGHVFDGEGRTRDSLDGFRSELTELSGRVERSEAQSSNLMDAVVSRLAARLDQAEAATSEAIQGLQSSFAALDERVRSVETEGSAALAAATEATGHRLDDLAGDLRRQVEAVRCELVDNLRAATDDRFEQVERALDVISGHVQSAETRSAAAIAHVGGEVARLTSAMDQRLAQSDNVHSQALERLSGEIARITERLSERIAISERRAAQAMDEVGEQVARVTDRIAERTERSTTELSERIRQSEDRTARMLEEAREKIDLRMAQTHQRLDEQAAAVAAASAAALEAVQAVATPAYVEPELALSPFADLEPEAQVAEPTEALAPVPFTDELAFAEPVGFEETFVEPAASEDSFAEVAAPEVAVPEALAETARAAPVPPLHFSSGPSRIAAGTFASGAYSRAALASLPASPPELQPQVVPSPPEPAVAEVSALHAAQDEDLSRDEFAPVVEQVEAEFTNPFADFGAEEDPFISTDYAPVDGFAAEAEPEVVALDDDDEEDIFSHGLANDIAARIANRLAALAASEIADAPEVSETGSEAEIDLTMAALDLSVEEEAIPESETLEPVAESDKGGNPFNLLGEPEMDLTEVQAQALSEFEPQSVFDPEPALAAEPEAEPVVPEPTVEARPLPIASEPLAAAAPRTTRQVVEDARAAARAAQAANDAGSARRPKLATLSTMEGLRPSSGDSIFSSGAFSSPRRGGARISSRHVSTMTAFGTAACVGLAIAGLAYINNADQKPLPDRLYLAVNGMLNGGGAANQQVAAVTLDGQSAAKTSSASGAQPAAPVTPRVALALSSPALTTSAASITVPTVAKTVTAPVSPVLAEQFAEAVRLIQAKDAAGLGGLRRTANLGYAPAQYYLGKLYETGGVGIKKDMAQARAWTERAAVAGEVGAMHNMGLYHYYGEGGSQNLAVAAQWFRRAADMGLLDSQFNLARLYESGLGVNENPAEAYKWYLIAARSGDGEARKKVIEIKAKLSPEAQATTERAAKAFKVQTNIPVPSQATAANSIDAVIVAQKGLSRLGYYQGPMDGTSSPALKMALAAYQRDQGLNANGALDRTVIDRLTVIAR
jgi:TPR repeat protein